MEKPFNFVFLGLTHGFIDDFVKEKSLIEEIKPEFVFSEDMENKKLISPEDYDYFLKNKKHSIMTKFEEVEKLVNLCRGREIKIIGIDFENFGFPNQTCKKILSGSPFTKNEEEEINKIAKKREDYHFKKLKESEKISKKPILVLLGSWHLRNEGLIMKNIKNAKVIFPANKRGDLVFEPTEEKIVYREIVL